MKIQIDTATKSIRLDSDVKFGELIKFLDKILPKEWKDYTIETNTVIYNWQNPIYGTWTIAGSGALPLTNPCHTVSQLDTAVTTSVYNLEIQN